MSSKPFDLKFFKSPEFKVDSFDAFTRMREHGEVFQDRIPVVGKAWFVTSYRGVAEVLRNTKNFVREPRNAGKKRTIRFEWLMPRIFKTLSKNMVSMDEPDHRRLRSLVEMAFVKSNVDGMKEDLVKLANLELDDVESIAKQNNGKVDLLEDFAREYPLAVITQMLGLPMEDRPSFRKWFSPIANVNSVFQIYAVLRGLKKVQKYLYRKFEDFRRNPQPGLISALIEVEQDGDQLDNDELLSLVLTLLFAGSETTTHLISNALLFFAQHPDQRKILEQDWSKAPCAINEILRYTSPVQMAKPRFVANDHDFFGTHLKRGELVLPVLAAANYDPAEFPDPGKFIIDRSPNRHMTFGSGPHVCLAMKLAQAEGLIAIQEIYRRYPNLRPTFDLQKPNWSKRTGMRALQSLEFQVHNS